MASVHRRNNHKSDNFIGSCFNAKAARAHCVGKPTIVKAARGDPILNVACNIVCNGKRFFGIQGWAMASVHLRIHHTFLNP